MKHEDLSRLQNAEILQAIREYQGLTADRFVLEQSKRVDWPLAAMAEQIQCRRKFSNKLPHFLEKDVLCTAESFEQSSSWYCAQYKASLFEVGSLLDVCGGLGVDSMAFAQAGFAVHYNDRDSMKSALCAWNTQQLDMRFAAITHHDAQRCLSEVQHQDYIYIDPSRRSGGERQRGLHQFQPDLAEIKQHLEDKCSTLILKLAPQTSLQDISDLFSGILHYRSVSLDGEAKECLIDVQMQDAGAAVLHEAHCLRRDGSALVLQASQNEDGFPVVDRALRYVYIPDPAVLLAGLCLSLSHFGRLSVLSASHQHLDTANAVLLSSDVYIADFPGRVYEVIDQQALARKSVRRYLKQQQIERAHVWRCQSRSSVAELRNLLALPDGGTDSCLVVGLADGRQWFIHARRAKAQQAG